MLFVNHWIVSHLYSQCHATPLIKKEEWRRPPILKGYNKSDSLSKSPVIQQSPAAVNQDASEHRVTRNSHCSIASCAQYKAQFVCQRKCCTSSWRWFKLDCSNLRERLCLPQVLICLFLHSLITMFVTLSSLIDECDNDLKWRCSTYSGLRPSWARDFRSQTSPKENIWENSFTDDAGKVISWKEKKKKRRNSRNEARFRACKGKKSMKAAIVSWHEGGT